MASINTNSEWANGAVNWPDVRFPPTISGKSCLYESEIVIFL